MKTNTIQPQERHPSGFTLLEMSAAMAVMMVVSSALVAMMQQHVAFLQRCQQQVFLTSKLQNRDSSEPDPEQRRSLLCLRHQRRRPWERPPNPDKRQRGETIFQISSANHRTPRFERGTQPLGSLLRFYTPQSTSPETSWTVSSKFRAASFLSEDGILSLSLLGPNYEQVTYYGGAR